MQKFSLSESVRKRNLNPLPEAKCKIKSEFKTTFDLLNMTEKCA